MKKIALVFLLFFCVINSFSQSVEINSNQVKRYYYRDSIISMEKWYGDDKKTDSIKTYYKTGELSESFYYNKGRYHGKSYKYNKKGQKVTTWLFENSKLINRENHIIEFNKKDEDKVKKLHVILKAINDSVTKHPNKLKFVHHRANIRHKLENYTLALNDYSRVQRIILKISKAKKVKPPKKILGSVYDAKASVYAHMEMKY